MLTLLEHGGRLREAAHQYGIPLTDWLDLSTGINPNGWQVPAIPAHCWQRLPEDNDELLPNARLYYQNSSLLAVAGSQAAIQLLPTLRAPAQVGVLHPAYAEHATGWENAGHQLRILDIDNIESELDTLDVLIIINPNNPTGKLWEPARLLDWHHKLSQRGGWLIVDEAFIDNMPEYSLSALPVKKGLIILRSVGKFFGLAGVRCGFMIAEQTLLTRIAEKLGPWTISHSARYVTALALADRAWQQAAILTLSQQRQRLVTLLNQNGWVTQGSSALFQWVVHPQAEKLHTLLARQGIFTRLFNMPVSLRFGLPGNELDWQRLDQALRSAEISGLLAKYG
ncbi:threonine-phosphate decarboxylase CobD [Methylomonas sp. AM2-LC]|uniref:threonine-phosphate decarboxylase CobD n=1 Tax=Methylomonas sp. AM2-LC TaxID=3153301 RepID=UPI003262F02E